MRQRISNSLMFFRLMNTVHQNNEAHHRVQRNHVKQQNHVEIITYIVKVVIDINFIYKFNIFPKENSASKPFHDRKANIFVVKNFVIAFLMIGKRF